MPAERQAGVLKIDDRGYYSWIDWFDGVELQLSREQVHAFDEMSVKVAKGIDAETERPESFSKWLMQPRKLNGR